MDARGSVRRPKKRGRHDKNRTYYMTVEMEINQLNGKPVTLIG